ncbi:hypothetical protein K1719_025346 [Acacia pycnantha]|nr:hypothetical protein K1719_025346 [Acacia pycnantha]
MQDNGGIMEAAKQTRALSLSGHASCRAAPGGGGPEVRQKGWRDQEASAFWALDANCQVFKPRLLSLWLLLPSIYEDDPLFCLHHHRFRCLAFLIPHLEDKTETHARTESLFSLPRFLLLVISSLFFSISGKMR